MLWEGFMGSSSERFCHSVSWADLDGFGDIALSNRYYYCVSGSVGICSRHAMGGMFGV